MIDEIQKSIKASLYERVTSPLLGAFTISWVFTNWQLLFITFFEGKTTLGKSKVQYIEDYIVNHNYKLWLIPIISTGIIIWLLPYLSELAFKLKEQSKARKLNIKFIEEDRVPLSIDESIKIRTQIKDLQKEFGESNSEKDLKISTLKTKNDELKNLISNKNEQIEHLNTQKGNIKSEKIHLDKYSSQLYNVIKNNNKTINDNFKRQQKSQEPRYLKFDKLEKQQIEIILNKYNIKTGSSRISDDDYEYLILKNLLFDTTPENNNKNYDLTELGLYISNQQLKQYF